MIEVTATWTPPICLVISPQKFSAATTFTTPGAPVFVDEPAHPAASAAASATARVARGNRRRILTP